MPNRVVCNQANDPIIVLLQDGNHFIGKPLQAKRQTPGDVDPVGVIGDDHFFGGRNAILDYQDGWKLDPGVTAVLYERSRPFVGPNEFDMHCFPPNGILPAYQQAGLGNGVNVQDTPNDWGVPAPAVGPRDGWNDTTAPNCWNKHNWGHYGYLRTGVRITVRVILIWEDKLGPADRQQLFDMLARAMGRWNGQPPYTMVDPPTGTQIPLVFAVEVVDQTAFPADVQVQVYKYKYPADTTDWGLNRPDTTLAHEYGHYLGLIDEYYLDSQNAPKGISAAAWESEKCPERGQERAQLVCPPSPNIMEDPDTTVIDIKMIDAINSGVRQRLCRRP